MKTTVRLALVIVGALLAALGITGCAGAGYSPPSCTGCDATGITCPTTISDCIDQHDGSCDIEFQGAGIDALVLHKDGTYTETSGTSTTAGTWNSAIGLVLTTSTNMAGGWFDVYENGAACPGGAQ